jgi:hypothetical protein
LAENARFAKIATDVQEFLAAAPLIRHQEISSLDARLLEWWNNLPRILKEDRPCPDSRATLQSVIRWRFYNQRMLLYRPMLLSYAMRRVPYIALPTEDRAAIEKCREMADRSIQDIDATMRPNPLCGWNAVWWTFQTALVPLIGLFLNDLTAGAEDPRASIEACQAQLKMAMGILERLHSYGHKAQRSLSIISGLFEASKRPKDTQPQNVEPVAGGGILRDEAAIGSPWMDDANDECWLQEYLSWSNHNFWPEV